MGSEPSSTPPAPPPEVHGRSQWDLFWRRLIHDRFAVAGAVIVLFITIMAIVAPLIAEGVVGHGRDDTFILEGTDEFGLPNGPSTQFWFGVDTAGRDLLVRVLYGARTSLAVGLLATGISVFIGLALGLAAGFFRGHVDTAISRLMDTVLSMPIFFLALGLVASCGRTKQGCLYGTIKPGIFLVSLVIGLFNWPYVGRVIRGETLSLREKEFVEAAQATGSSGFRILTREILPNLMAPLIVLTTLFIPTNILFEAGLSFLGIGVPAQIPSWGKMLAQASALFPRSWWLMFFPGMFLFLTTFGFNILGDGVRDAFNPRGSKHKARLITGAGRRPKRERLTPRA